MSDAEVKPTRSGRLLSLLQKFIDYGEELAATLRNASPRRISTSLSGPSARATSR